MNDFGSIENYIPHRKPMIMLDEIISIKDFQIQTAYTVKNDCIFVSKNELTEIGLIENMAQNSFVFLKQLFVDVDNKSFQNPEKTLGFISSIKHLRILKLPKVNQKLITTTTVELVFNSSDMKIIDVKGFTNFESDIIFESEMKMLVQTKS